MNEKYLQMALEKIPDRNTLITLASKRCRQLSNNARPLVKLDSEYENLLDIALKEIGEGAITFKHENDASGEMDFHQLAAAASR